MIQEYLFIGNEKRSEIENYRPDKVTVNIVDIENSECWIATYSISGENEENANILSKVNSHVVTSFDPTVLANGCAAYYNKLLFPCINAFERKLRKLLYLKSALNKGDKAADNIKNLESKDLGVIFTLLFTDEQFVKAVKASVNEKSWQFTKEEILKTVNKMSESTIWDSLIGVDSVPTLRKEFITVKDYRNDVMHAHDIDTKTFREAKKLFEQVNKQLDAEIRQIIDIAEKNPDVAENSDYNSDLSSALRKQDSGILGTYSSPFGNLVNPFAATALSDISCIDVPPIVQYQQTLQNASIALDTMLGSNVQLSSPLYDLSAKIESTAPSSQSYIAALEKYQEFASKLDIPALTQHQEIASKLDIPALTKYQEIASKIDVPAIAQTLEFQKKFQSMLDDGADSIYGIAKQPPVELDYAKLEANLLKKT